MAQVIKYIANGFLTDATKLLDEFFERNCLEFSAFADVWKKHNFSYIYMGRENILELNQFTQEIFKRTTLFLLSISFKKQVGAVFLLYALYRNQIIEPLIPIRIEFLVFRILKNLRDKAVEEKLRSLHYVLDYLLDNALMLVASQTLKGPTVRSVAKRFEPPGSLQIHFESALKEFKKSKLLEDLQASFALYGELRNSAHWLQSSLKLKEFIDGEQQLVERRNVPAEASSEPADVSDSHIGSRRAELKLKAAQFAQDERYSDHSHPTEEMECPPTVAEDVKKDCGIRRWHKRSSREEDPKQKVFDDESDDGLSELFKSKLPRPSEPRRHEKPHRIRRYYKEKPSSRSSSCMLSVPYFI